jgi:hypothetical protein
VTLDPREPLARFLFNKSDFSRPTQSVRPRAFMPSAIGETSVFRVQSLSEAKIWEIGLTVVAPGRTASLKGRAELRVEVPQSEGLQVTPVEAPERHAVIVGWPDEKDRRMIIAQVLAAESGLSLWENERERSAP